ncbi:MAG: hypothetical protein ACYCXE_04475 [Thermoleophilia bacterium]
MTASTLGANTTLDTLLPGAIWTPMFSGAKDGPLKVESRTGTRSVTSQRTLWPSGGSSLEEILGTDAGKLSSNFYWPWYDQQTAGMSDWIIIDNPNSFSVYYEVRIADALKGSGPIPAGGNITPEFAGVKDGPVHPAGLDQQQQSRSGAGRRFTAGACQRRLSVQ